MGILTEKLLQKTKKYRLTIAVQKLKDFLKETAKWGCGSAVVFSNQGLSIDKSFSFSQLYGT